MAAAAVTNLGEMSVTEECDIEIDHMRMEIGAAFGTVFVTDGD